MTALQQYQCSTQQHQNLFWLYIKAQVLRIFNDDFRNLCLTLMFQVGREGPNIEEVHHIQHLPPIENHHATMRLAGGTRTQQEAQAELRCQKDSRHRPLFLPLLLSDKKHGDKTLS